MNNINFNDGIEEITINNDPNRVIRFNSKDFGLLTRMQEARDSIKNRLNEALSKKIDEKDIDQVANMFKEVDSIAKDEIDKMFGEGVSKTVFGDTNTVTIDEDGNFIIENFFNAIIPYIAEKMEGNIKKRNEKISKYTDKYLIDNTKDNSESNE